MHETILIYKRRDAPPLSICRNRPLILADIQDEMNITPHQSSGAEKTGAKVDHGGLNEIVDLSAPMRYRS